MLAAIPACNITPPVSMLDVNWAISVPADAPPMLSHQQAQCWLSSLTYIFLWLGMSSYIICWPDDVITSGRWDLVTSHGSLMPNDVINLIEWSVIPVTASKPHSGLMGLLRTNTKIDSMIIFEDDRLVNFGYLYTHTCYMYMLICMYIFDIYMYMYKCVSLYLHIVVRMIYYLQ